MILAGAASSGDHFFRQARFATGQFTGKAGVSTKLADRLRSFDENRNERSKQPSNTNFRCHAPTDHLS
jgi:F0F1-type ATP synthase beta subunit